LYWALALRIFFISAAKQVAVKQVQAKRIIRKNWDKVKEGKDNELFQG
jgi:hypothetical protein